MWWSVRAAALYAHSRVCHTFRTTTRLVLEAEAMKRRSEDKSLAELQRNAPLDPRREAALERVRAKVAAVTALVSSTAAGLRRCGMLPFAPRDGASATSAASQRRHSDARRLRADADMIRRVLEVQEACVARCLAKAQ